jgi:predicted small metal-binding protein
MKRFECKDLGLSCEFRAEAENEEEVVAKAEEHAAAAHSMPKGDDTKNRIRTAVKDAA